ncbi:hypothetical protein BABINDRAFT_162056 [Babjeviella inositovora NRRL Y-12698]|uniref:Sec1-like protein n=1 Tax=Babjeviella inositovora NRRL Y-12698 TaxID=984486 RepID=A0A1E3QMS4_9ASCO|nr:uncharacterized protein BABINDRAFT_162056 [Babjeviella inositovora NRRL Y-12698]ODQ78971.1 hypothetical protein BABINDRAFT_162056 [Babjeviella inositovora NRRL Y-12698]
MTSGKLDTSIFKTKTLETLLNALLEVTTQKNLLVLDSRIIPLVNYLTPFSALKSHSHIEATINLDEFVRKLRDEPTLLGQFHSLIIIMDSAYDDSVSYLRKFLPSLPSKATTLIFRNLTKSLLFQVNEIGSLGLTFEDVIYSERAGTEFDANPFLTVRNWPTYALPLEENLLSLSRQDLDIQSYLNNPLHEVSDLADALVDITANLPLSFQNFFGKGDNACLLLDNFEKRLAARSTTLSEFETYELLKVGVNTDLVVLERNLDFISVLLTQLSYGGLVREVLEDEEFGIIETERLEDEELENKQKIRLDDPLYERFKNLNFSSIGHNLKKTAQELQGEFDSRHQASTINEIKNFVSNLGGLTSKQTDLKKHTSISEYIIKEFNVEGAGVPECVESASDSTLFFQNDLFELDYRAAIQAITKITNRGQYPLQLVVKFVVVLSNLQSNNEGIRLKDYEILKAEILQSYGVYPALFLLQKLEYHKILKVQPEGHSTSLFPFSLGSTPLETTTVASPGYKQSPLAGMPITGSCLKDFFLLANQLNLLPPLPETYNPETVEDFTTYPNQSFFYPGNYVPIVSRLVEALYLRAFMVNRPLNNLYKRPNWIGLNLSKFLAGNEIDKALVSEEQYAFPKKPQPQTSPFKEELVLVVMMGGITYSELVAMRYLESRMNEKFFKRVRIQKKLVVLTAGGFIKGDTLIGGLLK